MINHVWSGRMRLVYGILLVAALAPCMLSAGEPDEVQPGKSRGDALKVGDLAWMAGDWKGEIFGGPIREQWHAPENGAMIGSSVMGVTRDRAMYEFMLIEERDGVPTMFLRHFKQHLATKETEPMAFELESLDGKRAVFESSNTSQLFSRIVYERASKKELVVRLEGERDGKPVVMESRMSRLGE